MSVGSPTAGTWSSSQWRSDNEFETDRFRLGSRCGSLAIPSERRLSSDSSTPCGARRRRPRQPAMPIYRIENDNITPLERTTFAEQGLRERSTLQGLLKTHIDVIAPDTLVVAEEFVEWEDSRRRIDLLGVDKGANLVVIELKRTEDGGHMDLQSIRYAAMISTLTFDKLVTIYKQYLSDNGIELDAAEKLLEFLDWSEPAEEEFGQEVRIVLASAEFSKELTTAVMWLNDFGLDIRCVRMHPYVSDGQVFLDIQTVIPIPEVADYQVRIRQKKQKAREVREDARDWTKYDVTIIGQRYSAQRKRWMMFHLISRVLANGGTPEQVMEDHSVAQEQSFRSARRALERRRSLRRADEIEHRRRNASGEAVLLMMKTRFSMWITRPTC